MYSILDVRSVMVTDHTGKPEEINLVRLQNPWNDAQEWNGRCSDLHNDFWTDEVKQQFLDAYDSMRKDAGDSRFMHGWY